MVGSGIVYDSFGRITNLPAADAGGKELTTSYFPNDMVATQSQGGLTNAFSLDAELRQRQRVQEGGLEGPEIFHYDAATDSPNWTERGSTWTRNIAGIGGELAAVQESGSEIKLELTNLHGDVIATAALNPAETKLLATSRYDEFGNPVSGEAGRYGWLGSVPRRTELPSGVIQMGARSYVPSVGQFLSRDRIIGGAPTAYNYAGADPVDLRDLSGTDVTLPFPAPFFIGDCVFTATAVDEANGIEHNVKAAVTIHCTVGSTVITWLWAVAAYGTDPSPVTLKNVAKKDVLASPLLIYWSNEVDEFKAVKLCARVYWHEEGKLRHEKRCVPSV
jgi:RHS repeat-associated protein